MNDLPERLRQEIAAAGVVPFARFMELALYHPTLGYYEKAEPTPIGRHGDYFTSVSVGNLFGELLAAQFSEWLAAPAGLVQLVEAGAHDGALAADILNWFHTHRPAVFDGLEYWILEPSDRRRGWQEKTLRHYAEKIRWFTGWEAFPAPGVRGIIFANELLDSLPVRRFGWDAQTKAWFEWGVALDGDRFAWARMGASCGSEAWDRGNPTPIRHPSSSSFTAVLPDGFTVEVCPAAEAWWRKAAQALQGGKLLTLDYGWTTEEVCSPGRPGGTLRAYRRHQVSDDVLADPGEQDLTAHVDFSALQAAGESVGLETLLTASQAQFLVPIAARAWPAESDFGDWPAQRKRQFQTLTHPEHLGERFRVLIQGRP